MNVSKLLNVAFALIPLVTELLSRDPTLTDEQLSAALDEVLDFSKVKNPKTAATLESIDGPIILAIIKFVRALQDDEPTTAAPRM